MSTQKRSMGYYLHYSLFLAVILLFVGEILILLFATNFWASLIGSMLMAWGAACLAYYIFRGFLESYDAVVRWILKGAVVIGAYVFSLFLMWVYKFGLYHYLATEMGADTIFNLVVTTLEMLGLLPVVGIIFLSEQEREKVKVTPTLKK